MERGLIQKRSTKADISICRKALGISLSVRKISFPSSGDLVADASAGTRKHGSWTTWGPDDSSDCDNMGKLPQRIHIYLVKTSHILADTFLRLPPAKQPRSRGHISIWHGAYSCKSANTRTQLSQCRKHLLTAASSNIGMASCKIPSVLCLPVWPRHSVLQLT